MHFTLTDYKVREEFVKKWTERATKVKTMEEADKLNEEILLSLGQRFDYYRVPAQVEQSKKRSDPTFVGIGVAVEFLHEHEILDGLAEDTTFEDAEKLMVISDYHRFVLNPYKKSPADVAGVKPGDVLLKVDGKDVLGKLRSEVVDMVRGKEGTTVELTVERRDKDGKVVKTDPIKVMRQKYIAPVVSTRTLPDGVTYVKLNNFVAENAAQEMLEALTEAGKVKDGKLVLDLRDNGGGRLDHAINIIANMLSDGTIVTLRKREGSSLIKEHYTATLDAVFHTKPAQWNPSQIHYSAIARNLPIPTTMPIVVLVNEHSASASELTAGCLKFHRRAKIVGINTHGKGVGQAVVDLPDGRQTSVTIFFFDPADREIDFEGVRPDQEVSLEAEYKQLHDLRAELRVVLTSIKEAKEALADEKAEAAEKEKATKELPGFEAKEKELRTKLAALHTMLNTDDPQLKAARLLAVEEFGRISKEEAEKKAQREEMRKKKLEEWEKERKQREEEQKKGASSAANPHDA
jgi:carboxyl-terminal processing protease